MFRKIKMFAFAYLLDFGPLFVAFLFGFEFV